MSSSLSQDEQQQAVTDQCEIFVIRSREYYTNKMVSDPTAALADSGFSGFAIIGENSVHNYVTLEVDSQPARDLERDYLSKRQEGTEPLSSRPRSYVFGVGKQIAPLRQLWVRILDQFSLFDVLPGNIGAVVGRKFLNERKIILDFQRDECTTLSGRFTPAHILPASGGNQDTSHEKELSATKQLDVDGLGATHVRHDADKMYNIFVSSVQYEPRVEEHECDCIYDDILVVSEIFVSNDDDDDETRGAENREIERQILEQWSQSTTSNARPSGIREFWEAPTAKKNENAVNAPSSQFTKTPLSARTALVEKFPAKIWSLSPSLIGRFHRWRHAPASRMIKFFISCTPPEARETPEYAVWKKALQFWCEKVVKSCSGCQMNSRRFSRPVAIPRVWDLHECGMMDLMVLDSRTHTCCLVVVDLCTGQPALKLVRSHPPNSQTVFAAYVERWASVRGPHNALVVDRDGIFKSKASATYFEHLKIATDAVSSKEQLSQAERTIQTVRFTLDRTRDSDRLPETDDEWEFFLSVLENAISNEINRSGTSPAIREFGKATSLLSNILTDTSVSGSAVTEKSDAYRYIRLAEAARNHFQYVLHNDRLRDLMSTRVFDHEERVKIQNGDLVTFWRERDGGRNVSSRVGPAKVLGFDEFNRRFILEYRGAPIFADSFSVRLWDGSLISDDRDLFTSEHDQPAQPAPRHAQSEKSTRERQSTSDQAPIFDSAEEARQAQQRLLDQYNPPTINFSENNPIIFRPPSSKTDIVITCPKCKNPASHHSHRRDSPGCRLNPNVAQRLLERVAINILGGDAADKHTDAVISKNSIENVHDDETTVDQIWIEMCGSVDSQTHSWEDLSEDAKTKAFNKAIEAYDKYNAWDRRTDKTSNDFKFHKNSAKQKGIEIVVEDMTTVRGAKLDPHTKQIIGKVRIAPRGYNDKTWESIVFSTSPTASQASVRLSDIHGMRSFLLQVLIDFSDAFFQTKTIFFYHGEKREVWLKVTDPGIIPGASKENPIYRRLLKETPGCKNASRRWYERISGIFISAGYALASFDKSYFVKHDSNGQLIGAIPLHVDDAKCRLSQDEIKNLQKCFLQEAIVLNFFKVIPVGETIEFCGLMYTETEDGMRIDQHDYISKKLVQLPKINHKNDVLLENEDLSVYGKAIGKLIWILPTNVKAAYEITFLSRFRNSATAGLYRRLDQIIFRIRTEPGRIFLPRLRAEFGIKTIMIADASSGEAPPIETGVKVRDHGMQICLAAEATPPGQGGRAGIISSASAKLSKVTHSSFDSESINNVDSLDLAININETSTETAIGVCPNRRETELRSQWRAQRLSCEVHSDSHSFTRLVKIGLTHVLSRRRARDIEDARQALQDEDISCFLHVDGITNPADAGTKKNPSAKASETLDLLVHKGVYYPVASALTNEPLRDPVDYVTFLERYDISFSLK